MKTTRSLYLLLVAAMGFPVYAQVNANFCGPLVDGHFGPYDYRADKDPPSAGVGDHNHKLGLVEGAHFTPRVESLLGAQSGGRIGPPGADLDYTLRAFPNHHRALMSVMRYGEKAKNPQPPGLRWVVECYFERAVRFKPDDTIVRMIYSTYLANNNRQSEAIAQLEHATTLAGDNPFTHYNIGLVFFDMKIYDKALARAHQALALGFEREELRELLKKANQWKEPLAEPKSPQ
jgi:tetratricopeptide (TPR) repeat protein